MKSANDEPQEVSAPPNQKVAADPVAGPEDGAASEPNDVVSERLEPDSEAEPGDGSASAPEDPGKHESAAAPLLGAAETPGTAENLKADAGASQATVFQPRAPAPSDALPTPVEDSLEETVFQPVPREAVPSEPLPTSAAPAEGGRETGSTTVAPPVSSAERVEVGAVLNGLYEVTRFIARGGMGEVWEGRNINDEHDRVAIKVVLPSLAADPNVQAMFRKEARTLKRLTHAAVVQYRVIASDPRLNILYIVTDFVDGVNLADAVPTLRPGPGELRGLLRRLAEGLKAAHEIGAIHRDMSPDNVILEDGRIDRARIIDFGVAKDLDPSKGTIVGDGFAGKIGFVAPEQFGDFGREVGPWTDVYSLGLVILAVAAGRNPDMGATLVDAVDRRRQGVDLSAAPEELRPVMAGMLTADPTQRLRSMDAVLAALDGAAPAAEVVEPKGKEAFGKRSAASKRVAPMTDAGGHAAPADSARPPDASPLGAVKAWLSDSRHRMIAFGGAGLTVAALGAVIVAVLVTSGGEPRQPTPVPAEAVPDGEQVRRAIEASLPGIPCSWLDVDYLEAVPGGVAVRLSGPAGDGGAAQSAIQQAMSTTGVTVTDQNLEGVVAAPASHCAALDLFRPMRAETSAGSRSMTSPQSRWVMEPGPNDGPIARLVVDLDLKSQTANFVLLAIDELGGVNLVSAGREELERLAPRSPQSISKTGPDSYRLTVPVLKPGQYAFILLRGPGTLDQAVLNPAPSSADWSRNVQRAAATLGWKAEITWHEVTAG